jgi:hypothetical protein
MRLLIALIVALAAGGAALFVIFTVGAVRDAVQKLATDAGAELWMIAVAIALFLGGAVMGVTLRVLRVPAR